MANVILKVDRGVVIYYYTYQKKLFRRTTGLKITDSELNADGDIKPSFLNKHPEITKHLNHLNDIVNEYLIKNNNIKPPVSYLTSKVDEETQKVKIKNDELIPYYDNFYNHKKEQFKNNPQRSIESLRDFTTTYNSLKDFELHHDKKLYLNNINSQFIDQYNLFMWAEHKSTPTKKYITEGGNKNNTLNKKLDCMFMFFRWLSDNDLLQKIPKRPQIDKPIVEKITLNKNEIKKLYKIDFKNDNLNRVRDIFVFSSLTGFRWGDFSRLKKEHFKIKNNTLFVKKQTEKTGVFVDIPLTNTAESIIKKYDYQFNTGSNQHFNRMLKIIGEKSNLLNDKIYGKYRYQQLTSHTARHSFITNLVESNISINYIMKLTGHQKLETLNIYLEKKELEDNKLLNKALD